MARKKKSVHKVKTPVDPNIETIYEEEITFTCPVRGLIKQKVKVKRYKPQNATEEKPILKDCDSDLLSQIDGDDDVLSIFTEEDLSTTAEDT